MAENNESGYKFVIVILVGTLSFLYYSYIYIQNTALNIYEYFSLCLLASFAIILIIAYFIYFIIKGFSMELQGENHDKLENIATKIYLINLLIFTYIIILVITTIAIINLPLSTNLYTQIGLSVVFQLIFLLILFVIDMKYVKIVESILYFIENTLDISGKLILLILIFFIIFWFISLFYIMGSLYQGNIELEMDKIYYKNDKQIPVLIKVTGNDLVYDVTLFNITSNNLTERGNITKIGPNYYKDLQKKDFFSNDLLMTSSLGDGRYIIFINTTNLNPGYYQLKFSSSQKLGKYSEASGFYILDNKNYSIDGFIN